jgi:hypothetical protein
MDLEFDLNRIAVTEFGVGLDNGVAQTFFAVPVDANVQNALLEMVQETWNALQRDEAGPAKYEPSEKHGSTEFLYVPIDDDMAASLCELHKAENLGIDPTVLSKTSSVFCYFARLTDKRKRRLTALRRATQFKGVLRKRLVRLVSNSLKLIDDNVFKLDRDFDLLVDSVNVHILRPSGFEFAGQLQQCILDAVPTNIQTIQRDLPFVNLEGLELYASNHPRAARYLASIKGQEDIKSIDRSALRSLCKRTGVEVKLLGGKLIVQPGHEMGFLEVLDRRRYELKLMKGRPERFKAMSRRKIGSEG